MSVAMLTPPVPDVAGERPIVRRRRVQPLDLVAPVAVALWLLAVATTHIRTLTDYGLAPSLPITWYLALVVVVIGFVVELGHAAPSTRRLALAIGVLVLLIHGTSPALFDLPHYNWVYKHLGVAKQLLADGNVKQGADIYQHWPGFFALTAWITTVTGVSDPIVLARWTQVLVDGFVCVELYWLFGLVRLDQRTKWTAILIFVLGNWVAQDYFAPQALAFVLALAFFGVVLGGLQRHDPAFGRTALRLWRLDERLRRVTRARFIPADEPLPPYIEQRWLRASAVVLALTLFGAIVVSHQLTPYLLIGGIGALTAAGRVRPRWLVLAMVAIAGLYLLPRFDFVSERYGSLLAAPFRFLNNAKGNAIVDGGAPGRIATVRAARLLSLLVWSLAGVGAIRRYRRREAVLVPALLAAAPMGLLLMQDYGGEAIYRVFLFSLPWSALLAASALRGRTARRTAIAVLGFALVVTPLLLQAYFGGERTNRVWTDDLAAATYFYAHAPAGSTLMLAAPNFPVRDAANYSDFAVPDGDFEPNLMRDEEFRGAWLTDHSIPLVERAVRANRRPTGPAFLAIGRGQREFADEFRLVPHGSLDALDRALARAPHWRVFFRRGDAVIYELMDAR